MACPGLFLISSALLWPRNNTGLRKHHRDIEKWYRRLSKQRPRVVRFLLLLVRHVHYQIDDAVRISPFVVVPYLFSHIGIDRIAIGITDLILKSKGSRGLTRASALAGMIASAPDFERSGDSGPLRSMPHGGRSKSGAEAIIERVALPAGPAKALAP
jgi:hypothetical protein